MVLADVGADIEHRRYRITIEYLCQMPGQFAILETPTRNDGIAGYLNQTYNDVLGSSTHALSPVAVNAGTAQLA
jgi:hypothetical protein